MRKSRFQTVIPGLPHHIIHRGNNRRRLFSYPQEYRAMLRLWECWEDFDVPIHGLCLLANHLHKVVTPPSATALSAFVKSWAQCYAQRRNKARGGSGKLFEERFISIPITTEAQLQATLMYIERNPVEAGIKADPADYRWSTYSCHTGLGDNFIPPRIWTPSHWYESLSEDPVQRRLQFIELYGGTGIEALSVEQLEAIADLESWRRLYTRRLERPNRNSAA